MNDFIELLSFSFFKNALLAAILTSTVAGIVGTYIVARRNVFISGGITHASFGGMGIAYFFGLSPLLGAALFAIASALGIEWSSKKAGLREDSAIAIIWSLGMAIGIIFVFLTPGYTPNLMGFLFGDILTVKITDLILLAVLAVIIVVLTIIYYQPILFTAFDSEYAQTVGYKSTLIRYIISIVIAISIVLSIKIMGIILVLSLFTIPPSAANLFSKSFKSIIWYSVIISLTGSIAGLLFAYLFDLPSGATIIFTLTGIYVLLRILKTIIRN
ncbi:metal ABC transporter permease [Carboxylicivirga caseinilyticus]|uniref:metal ABC transporter permease n=1 Tax=Carboxylicivirga caseinilyticus TaxID=3417572 RepID=UPI003D333198|nr:metal ABC transporter permease [Marinilabiliaceae bacterium A049]